MSVTRRSTYVNERRRAEDHLAATLEEWRDTEHAPDAWEAHFVQYAFGALACGQPRLAILLSDRAVTPVPELTSQCPHIEAADVPSREDLAHGLERLLKLPEG